MFWVTPFIDSSQANQLLYFAKMGAKSPSFSCFSIDNIIKWCYNKAVKHIGGFYD